MADGFEMRCELASRPTFRCATCTESETSVFLQA